MLFRSLNPVWEYRPLKKSPSSSPHGDMLIEQSDNVDPFWNNPPPLESLIAPLPGTTVCNNILPRKPPSPELRLQQRQNSPREWKTQQHLIAAGRELCAELHASLAQLNNHDVRLKKVDWEKAIAHARRLISDAENAANPQWLEVFGSGVVEAGAGAGGVVGAAVLERDDGDGAAQRIMGAEEGTTPAAGTDAESVPVAVSSEDHAAKLNLLQEDHAAKLNLLQTLERLCEEDLSWNSCLRV